MSAEYSAKSHSNLAQSFNMSATNYPSKNGWDDNGDEASHPKAIGPHQFFIILLFYSKLEKLPRCRLLFYMLL